MKHIVLVDPEIPQNTGNIARTCACTGTELILCGRLGFVLDDKYLRRAGMDYIRDAEISVYPDLDTLFEERSIAHYHLATRKASFRYDSVRYDRDEYLIFGCESRGLDDGLIRRERERCVRIPMQPGFRSLNLAVSAALVLYEALRQDDFSDLDDPVGRGEDDVHG